MKITLGTGLGLGGRRSGNAFNAMTCSPGVLLENLEERLGLAAARPGHAQRIAAYRTALTKRLEAGPAFYRASFERDPFAVAETLLQWRDELSLHGLDLQGEPVGTDRIDCLLAVERHFAAECRCGEGERIRAVIARLERVQSGVESVTVLDPEEWFPRQWRELLTRLPECRFTPPDFAPAADSDLGRFQASLKDDQPAFDFQNDGSIRFVTAYSEAVLANAAAGVVSRATDAVWVEGDNLQLVDEALRRRDQPVAGVSARSRFRPVPQLLNLALQLQWKPFDPQRLLDFLVHPACPVNWLLRDRLAGAIIEEPGFGGPEWRAAIGGAREAAAKRHADDPAELQKATNRIERDLADWLGEPQVDQDRADTAQLAEAAERLGKWANGRAQMDDAAAPMFARLRAMTAEFTAIIREEATTTRASVERVLRQLAGGGVGGSDGPAELNHVPVQSAAGFVAPVDNVLWWNFAEPHPAPASPWTAAELTALAAHDIRPPAAADLARWETERQQRPVFAAREKLVLFKAAQRDGEELPEHPLWTRLRAALKAAKQPLPTVDVDRVLIAAEPATDLETRPPLALPGQRRWLNFPADTTIAPRARESFSSLKKLVHGPFEWLCDYPARLRAGNLANSRLAVDARLQGQLVHRLIELMFPPAGPAFDCQDSDDAALANWIEGHWPRLLREEGAQLLLPGHQGTEVALRTMAHLTLTDLIAKLRLHGATEVVADYHPEPQPFGEGELRGDVDLCYRSAKGDRVVVDLKFGGHDVRRQEVADNTALQLAVYGHLLSDGQMNPPPRSAFYILTRHAWLTGDGPFFDVRSVDEGDDGPPDLRTCWSRFQDLWNWRWEQLRAGRVEVTFDGTEESPESEPPHSAWKLKSNDGKYSDVVNLAGWKEGA